MFFFRCHWLLVTTLVIPPRLTASSPLPCSVPSDQSSGVPTAHKDGTGLKSTPYFHKLQKLIEQEGQAIVDKVIAAVADKVDKLTELTRPLHALWAWPNIEVNSCWPSIMHIAYCIGVCRLACLKKKTPLA